MLKIIIYSMLLLLRTPMSGLASMALIPMLVLTALWGIGFGVMNMAFMMLVMWVVICFALATQYDAMLRYFKPDGYDSTGM